MRRATTTLTPDGDGELRFPYTPHGPFLIADLKQQIPQHSRAWNPEGKHWWIAADYVNLAVRITEDYFYDLGYQDAPRQRATPPSPPPRPLHADPYEVLHLRPTAPPELIEAAARAPVKLHHPDPRPEHEKLVATVAMAKINRAVEDLRRRRGAA